LAALPTPPSRVEQVYDAIVEEICTGRLAPGTPLRQELLAQRFQVSRHPVQQALLLLKNQGLLREFGRRGLEVTPLDSDYVGHVYQLRAVLDGYAARASADRISAEGLRRGHDLVKAGKRAFAEPNFAEMIIADVEFHRLLVEESGNPLLVESTAVLWRNVQRVMSEVHLAGGVPAWVWDDHAAILEAVEARDGARAEALARQHAEHGERVILDTMATRRASDPTSSDREINQDLASSS
jgi:DNA-binding GntR family transcriptional regulator